MEMFPRVSSVQKFKPRDIHRSEIKNAPYNPRTITPEAREKLKASLGEFGLVNAFVWNRRTGNLVGGHQRLSIIDDLEQDADYSLTVDEIDIDEDREKALNVVLNAKQAQGEYDQSMLAQLLAEIEGKISFNVNAILAEAEAKRAVTLRKVSVPKPPRMTWTLVGIPTVSFGSISGMIEAIAGVDGTIVETSVADGREQK